jgi:hypothetical protein
MMIGPVAIVPEGSPSGITLPYFSRL